MQKKTNTLDEALGRANRRRSFPKPIERRSLRLRAGLTQTDVANAIGSSAATVSRYETGTREPNAKTRERYGKVLDRLAKEVT